MKCSFKTMITVAAGLFAAAAVAYFTFEEARAAIVASLPFLLVLLCPISMLLMMKSMHSDGKGADERGASCATREPRDDRKPVEVAR